jgi:uncharacterized protein HemY
VSKEKIAKLHVNEEATSIADSAYKLTLRESLQKSLDSMTSKCEAEARKLAERADKNEPETPP